MSKSAELYNLYHSFSGDSTVKTQSRNGDSTDEGATRWDFIASVQSAESDIIDEEERAEQHEAKRKFARLLGLYLKKILTPVEFKFLVACMRAEQTPYKVGRALGVDYKTTIPAINAKHKENLPKLRQLMRACGYDYRRGLVLMPELTRYCAVWEHKRIYERTKRAEDGDSIRAYFREYAKRHRKERAQYMNKWRAANRDKVNARRRELYDPAKNSEKWKKYSAVRKARRQANPEKTNAEARKWYAANKEKKLAACKAYRDAHKDEINARRRAREAAKRAEQKEVKDYAEDTTKACV